MMPYLHVNVIGEEGGGQKAPDRHPDGHADVQTDRQTYLN